MGHKKKRIPTDTTYSMVLIQSMTYRTAPKTSLVAMSPHTVFLHCSPAQRTATVLDQHPSLQEQPAGLHKPHLDEALVRQQLLVGVRRGSAEGLGSSPRDTQGVTEAVVTTLVVLQSRAAAQTSPVNFSLTTYILGTHSERSRVGVCKSKKNLAKESSEHLHPACKTCGLGV